MSNQSVKTASSGFRLWLSGVTLILPILTAFVLSWMRSFDEKVIKLEALTNARGERVATVETRVSFVESRINEIGAKLTRIEDKIDQLRSLIK